MMFKAFELVRERQAQIVTALSAVNVEYALSGSNATYAWIASIEECAVRAFQNVEFIVRPCDESKAIEALINLKATVVRKPDRLLFRYRPEQRDRFCDCMLPSGMRLPQGCSVPKIMTECLSDSRVLSLPVLVRFQLERWLLDDMVDLRDMIGVGLLDYSWLERLQPELSSRLKELLDDPDG